MTPSLGEPGWDVGLLFIGHIPRRDGNVILCLYLLADQDIRTGSVAMQVLLGRCNRQLQYVMWAT